jgi:hypothetical protein
MQKFAQISLGEKGQICVIGLFREKILQKFAKMIIELAVAR